MCRKAHARALETLKGLKSLGIKDLGIAVTISDQNAKDLVALYRLACENGVELATAILHNAYYFHKDDNVIEDKAGVEAQIEEPDAGVPGVVASQGLVPGLFLRRARRSHARQAEDR